MTRCRGCGIELQTKDKNKLGYIENKEQTICSRCFKLSNYGEYQKVSLTNKDYTQIINSIPKESLVVYTTDILTLNLKNISQFSKVILVVTKKDIIPKSVKDQKIINFLLKQNPNILDIIITSSNKNYNIDTLYNSIIKYSNNQEVYIVGATNTGKSTLINKLIKNYSFNESKITTSIYPSTTLDKVIITLNNLTIIDTPGLIDEDNITNYLSKKDLKKITPKKEIKPKTCQITDKGSIVIDNYARIDYETELKNSMVIYCSNDLNTRFNSLKNDHLTQFPSCEYNLKSNQDIVIPGLAFIKFTKPIKLKIYTIENVKPFIRDNLI